MDSVQKILIIVVVALTILLVLVGIQVIMVIVDLRRSIKRLNSILEDALLGGGLIRPEKITGILEIFKRRKKLETREQGTLQNPSPRTER